MRLATPLHRFARAFWFLVLAAFWGAAPMALQAQTSVQIHDIMVAGNNPIVGTAATKTLPYSTYYGQTVSVTGIVVGVMSSGDYTGASTSRSRARIGIRSY